MKNCSKYSESWHRLPLYRSTTYKFTPTQQTLQDLKVCSLALSRKNESSADNVSLSPLGFSVSENNVRKARSLRGARNLKSTRDTHSDRSKFHPKHPHSLGNLGIRWPSHVFHTRVLWGVRRLARRVLFLLTQLGNGKNKKTWALCMVGHFSLQWFIAWWICL